MHAAQARGGGWRGRARERECRPQLGAALDVAVDAEPAVGRVEEEDATHVHQEPAVRRRGRDVVDHRAEHQDTVREREVERRAEDAVEIAILRARPRFHPRFVNTHRERYMNE